MKKMLLIVLVVVFSLPVFGQYLEGTSVNQGNIHTTDSEVIEAQYIVFMKDSLEFYLKNSETRYSLGLNQVNEVLRYNGDYAMTGGWIGFGVGAVIFTVMIAESSSSSGLYESTDILVPTLIWLGCSTVGYLIGLAIEDWETVYSKSGAFLRNFNIKQNNHNGLAVSYRVYF